jgi:MFS transporter, DHA2 family, lincomycin resistance protein
LTADNTPRTTDVAVPPTAPEGPAMTPEASRVIWLLLVAAFVAILNETTMGIAIPHLIVDLHITAVAAQWLTTAFMLTMAVVIPITGFLIQRFTTRQIFLAAMSLFTLGTALALVSPGFEMLVVARVVQASGTAIMMPLLMTTLMTVVAPHARGRLMGRVSIVISLAPAIGPTLSGFLLEYANWRWIFGVVLPIAIVALVLGWRFMLDLGERTHARIDYLSIVLSAFGFGGLIYGLSQIGGHSGAADAGATPEWVLPVAFAVGIVALALFMWRQLGLQRRDDALLDLRVFRSANFTISVIHMTVLSAAFFGTITLLPLYLSEVHKLRADESGLIVLPGALVMGFAGPLIGRIYDRWGTRVLLIPGTIVSVVVLWVYTTLTATTPVWEIVVLQSVLSLGLAMSFTPLFTASLGSLEPHFYSYGSAALSTLQQVGGAAGIALLVTISTSVGAVSGLETGMQDAFRIAAIIGIPLIIGAFLVRKPADSIGGPPAH